jgi:rubredoxin-NAD+ reductase
MAGGVTIVGSGLGGYTLARELRKQDRRCPITVLTADGGELYSKPMLSNAFQERREPDALVLKGAEQAAQELGATVLRRTRVTAIDRARKVLHIADHAEVAYDRLVLAIGADPRPYSVPGGDRVPIVTVNDLDDYRRWRQSLIPGGRVLLIGAGLIGCEFANDLSVGGYRVAIVDPAPWPLGRLLPQLLGRQLEQALTECGIVVHCRRSVSQVVASAAGGFVAVLDDGSEVSFDRALSAIGLMPRTGLAVAAGLTVDRGIVVDRNSRTSDPAIFAIGDCAQGEAGPLPFILPLMAQTRALAATLNGNDTPLVMPAMPIVVKTACLPVVVCPPPTNMAGQWQIDGEGADRKALFLDNQGRAQGFALSGAAAAERQALAKEMPNLLG